MTIITEKYIETFTLTFVVLFLCLICLLVGSKRGTYVTESRFQKEAVEKGFAHYNPTNGNWQWLKLEVK